MTDIFTHTISSIEHQTEIDQFINFLEKIQDENVTALPKNFNLSEKPNSAHILNILRNKNGRFYQKNAGFICIYNKDMLIACGGYHPHSFEDKHGLLVLSRFFINKSFRAGKINIIDDHWYPEFKNKMNNIDYLWMSFNDDRAALYKAFERQSRQKSTMLGDNWPNFFTNFHPIGIKTINFTQQYVVEYKVFNK